MLIPGTDIRSLAQQIGQQKNNNQRLALDSTQYQFKKSLQYDCEGILGSVPFWHYEVTLFLTKSPDV